MRKDLGANPLSYPQPVWMIASYDEAGSADCMNAAWVGISGPSEVTMCLSADHKTVKNILAVQDFTVSMADAAHVVECDYLGIVSGNDIPDKLERAGFHTTRSANVNAPLIDELAMAMECRLKSYDPVTGHMVAEIVNVVADESILTPEGGIDVAKLAPICFDPVNNLYHVLGEQVGVAFADGQKLM